MLTNILILQKHMLGAASNNLSAGATNKEDRPQPPRPPHATHHPSPVPSPKLPAGNLRCRHAALYPQLAASHPSPHRPGPQAAATGDAAAEAAAATAAAAAAGCVSEQLIWATAALRSSCEVPGGDCKQALAVGCWLHLRSSCETPGGYCKEAPAQLLEKLLAAGCWLLAALPVASSGCCLLWLLAAVCCLLPAGCWLLATGCCLLSTVCCLLPVACCCLLLLLSAVCWLLLLATG